MKKICTTCKKELEIENFGLYHQTKDGYQYNCKKCACEYTKQYYRKNRKKVLDYHKKYSEQNSTEIKKKYKKYSQSPRGRYSTYKKSAKKDNKDFLLSFGDFMTFWNKKCFYCNSEINTIGLDRKNNQLGYIKTNIVPCCTICNKMKLQLSYDDFINHISKIYNFIVQQKNQQ